MVLCTSANMKRCSVADDACFACSTPPAQFARCCILRLFKYSTDSTANVYSVHCLLTYTVIGILASKLRFMLWNAKYTLFLQRFLTCIMLGVFL